MCINLIFYNIFVISPFYEWQVIKDCEGPEILSYLHTSKLFLVSDCFVDACRRHSLLGLRHGLYYSCYSTQHELHALLVPVLHSLQRLCRVSRCHTPSEWSHRRGTLNVGTPVFYNEPEANLFLVLEGEIISAFKDLML